MKISIAQVKVYPKKGDLNLNGNTLMAILKKLIPYKPDVVITPEAFLDGYVVTLDSISKDQLPEYAIDADESTYINGVTRWAQQNEAWAIVGCARKKGAEVYNSALIIDRKGTLVGSYDKTHLQRHDKKYTQGNLLPVFDSDFGLFGVMICADRRWPETVRTLALKGARIIFNPTYGMCDELNRYMMCTRSYESEVFIAFTHPHQSLITDPYGKIVCNNEKDGEDFTITQIELNEVERARSADLAHLRDRRSDVYEL